MFTPTNTNSATPIIIETMRMWARLQTAGIIHGVLMKSTTCPTANPGPRERRSDAAHMLQHLRARSYLVWCHES
ncbi:hypothetical protein GCM10009776_33510 [Microbacterium deminutum]|uniref:Uncharacterized protein n=1 Tax=Microbacterium deminutum TaxID=344164 RepID=A0ABP5CRK9_9MICO